MYTIQNNDNKTREVSSFDGMHFLIVAEHDVVNGIPTISDIDLSNVDIKLYDKINKITVLQTTLDKFIRFCSANSENVVPIQLLGNVLVGTPIVTPGAAVKGVVGFSIDLKTPYFGSQYDLQIITQTVFGAGTTAANSTIHYDVNPTEMDLNKRVWILEEKSISAATSSDKINLRTPCMGVAIVNSLTSVTFTRATQYLNSFSLSSDEIHVERTQDEQILFDISRYFQSEYFSSGSSSSLGCHIINNDDILTGNCKLSLTLEPSVVNGGQSVMWWSEHK